MNHYLSRESIPLIELVIISEINRIRGNNNGSVEAYLKEVHPYYDALIKLAQMKAEYEL